MSLIECKWTGPDSRILLTELLSSTSFVELEFITKTWKGFVNGMLVLKNYTAASRLNVHWVWHNYKCWGRRLLLNMFGSVWGQWVSRDTMAFERTESRATVTSSQMNSPARFEMDTTHSAHWASQLLSSWKYRGIPGLTSAPAHLNPHTWLVVRPLTVL